MEMSRLRREKHYFAKLPRDVQEEILGRALAVG